MVEAIVGIVVGAALSWLAAMWGKKRESRDEHRRWLRDQLLEHVAKFLTLVAPGDPTGSDEQLIELETLQLLGGEEIYGPARRLYSTQSDAMALVADPVSTKAGIDAMTDRALTARSEFIELMNEKLRIG